MRVMVFIKATEGSENAAPPTMEAFEAMETFNEALVAAGVLVAGAGLKPTAEGKRILFDGEEQTIIDGPFTETKEAVAGFSIWQVKDMDEALAWVKRCPNPMAGRCEVELRPFLEEADMADLLGMDDQAREKLGVA